MPNGQEVNDDLEFETHISDMDTKQLLEFNARQIYLLKKELPIVVNLAKEVDKRSRLNLIGLLLLVVVLITLGILDGSLLRMFL